MSETTRGISAGGLPDGAPRHSFHQPDIPKPDRSDPLFWAVTTRHYADWIRAAGPQMGINAGEVVLGLVLETIIKDDANCLSWYNPDVSKPIKPERSQLSKKFLLERLDWEIGVPEVPVAIKTVLETTYQVVLESDWNTHSGLGVASKQWNELKAFVENEVEKEDSGLKKAMQAYSLASKQLSPLWNEFVG